MNKTEKKKLDKWLSECPLSVITNIDSGTPLRHIEITKIAYPDDILILTNMEHLSDLCYELDKRG